MFNASIDEIRHRLKSSSQESLNHTRQQCEQILADPNFADQIQKMSAEKDNALNSREKVYNAARDILELVNEIDQHQ